ncbi:MAG: hypothetical protein ACKVHL_09185, partial [Rhodospirillales bacterium]
NKSFHLPKGTPKAVVKAWRDATRNVMKDPKFKKKAGKIIGPYSATIGAPAAKIIKEKLNLPAGAKKYIEKFLKDHYELTMDLS